MSNITEGILVLDDVTSNRYAISNKEQNVIMIVIDMRMNIKAGIDQVGIARPAPAQRQRYRIQAE
jgi:hypothetical protein